MKIDAEEAEAAVPEGAKYTLRFVRPILLIEVRHENFSKVYGILLRYDYIVEPIKETPEYTMILSRAPENSSIKDMRNLNTRCDSR